MNGNSAPILPLIKNENFNYPINVLLKEREKVNSMMETLPIVVLGMKWGEEDG